MPFDLQTRLLRVLSDGSFYRVGHTAVKTNVRVIALPPIKTSKSESKPAASVKIQAHRDSPSAFHCERREDVFMLTRHFLQQSAKQLGVEPVFQTQHCSSSSATSVSMRQLENICHWLSVMAPAQVVEPACPRCWNVPEALRLAAARTAMPVPSAAAYAGMPAPVAIGAL
jgi:two-component system nitrogen regulation response regulator GlnG